MVSPLHPALAALTHGQHMALWILGLSLTVPTILGVVGICAGAWAKVNRLRSETALKQQMIERGMAAEDIVSVVRSRGRGDWAVDSPCASEVVALVDDEWQTALVLKREGERYFVHVVGTEMSENRWVPGGRVRFPAGSHDPWGSPWDWASASVRCARPGRMKPAGVDQEL